MPTNTKEYMKNYQRERRARLKEERKSNLDAASRFEKPLQPLQKPLQNNVKETVRKRVHSPLPTRGSMRGIKHFLGLPEDHTLGATIQTECQDIINHLEKIKPQLKVRVK